MDFLSTVKGSLLEGFYPKGWDLKKIDECLDKGVTREDFWNKDFNPVECDNIYEFDTLMGHEIAQQIKLAREEGKKLARGYLAAEVTLVGNVGNSVLIGQRNAHVAKISAVCLKLTRFGG